MNTNTKTVAQAPWFILVELAPVASMGSVKIAGNAIAVFPTRAAALREQLSRGLRSTTEVIEF